MPKCIFVETAEIIMIVEKSLSHIFERDNGGIIYFGVISLPLFPLSKQIFLHLLQLFRCQTRAATK
jgi:hypothetical protein